MQGYDLFPDHPRVDEGIRMPSVGDDEGGPMEVRIADARHARRTGWWRVVQLLVGGTTYVGKSPTWMDVCNQGVQLIQLIQLIPGKSGS